MTTQTHAADLFVVVYNQEDQYSVWPAGRDLPDGWSQSGSPTTREECLDHVERLWTDMRPRTVRDQPSRS